MNSVFLEECVLIIGATSPLAQELAKLHIESGHNITLTSSSQKGEALMVARDLQIRFLCNIRLLPLDLMSEESINNFVTTIKKENLYFKRIYFVSGYVANSYLFGEVVLEINKTIQINFSGPAVLLSSLFSCGHLAKTTLVVVSSVAGDRGRDSNFPYGAAKCALNVFCDGLRLRLWNEGSSVTIVKLGFMESRMSVGRSVPLLTASAKYCATKIRSAADKEKSVVYVPLFWTLVMIVIRSIPTRLRRILKLW